MAKRGRPTIYSDALAHDIALRIITGRSVACVCADHDMPSQDTFYRWMLERSEFSEKIAHAREERAEARSEQMLAIGERALEDKDLDPARARIAIDAIDKATRLMQPKTSRVEMTGKGGGPLVINFDKIDSDL